MKPKKSVGFLQKKERRGEGEGEEKMGEGVKSGGYFHFVWLIPLCVVPYLLLLHFPQFEIAENAKTLFKRRLSLSLPFHHKTHFFLDKKKVWSRDFLGPFGYWPVPPPPPSLHNLSLSRYPVLLLPVPSWSVSLSLGPASPPPPPVYGNSRNKERSEKRPG